MSGAAELERLRAALEEAARKHLDASNEKRRPQWFSKAHAHAYRGLMEAIGICEAQGAIARRALQPEGKAE